MEQKTYLDQIRSLVFEFGPKVLVAILLLTVGLWLIRRLTNTFGKVMARREVDESLRPFLISMADVALKVALLLMVAGQVGIETTSFIAVFSAVAFAVGMALQGSLGNFASGVLILLFRPYKVGDLLRVGDHLGYVVEIQIFNTILTNEYGKKIIIPNGKMTEGPIENTPMGAEVQAEVSLLIDHEANLAVVREAADAAAARCPWRLPKHPTDVVVSGLNRDDMKVDFAWWTLGEHYIQTMDFFHETLREELGARGIKLAKERRREGM